MSKTISDLRAVLFETLDQLRDKEKPMEIERAKAVSDIAGRLIETAKVECQYLNLVGGHGASGFLEAMPPPAPKPDPTKANGARQLATERR